MSCQNRIFSLVPPCITFLENCRKNENSNNSGKQSTTALSLLSQNCNSNELHVRFRAFSSGAIVFRVIMSDSRQLEAYCSKWKELHQARAFGRQWYHYWENLSFPCEGHSPIRRFVLLSMRKRVPFNDQPSLSVVGQG